MCTCIIYMYVLGKKSLLPEQENGTAMQVTQT